MLSLLRWARLLEISHIFSRTWFSKKMSWTLLSFPCVQAAHTRLSCFCCLKKIFEDWLHEAWKKEISLLSSFLFFLLLIVFFIGPAAIMGKGEEKEQVLCAGIESDLTYVSTQVKKWRQLHFIIWTRKLHTHSFQEGSFVFNTKWFSWNNISYHHHRFSSPSSIFSEHKSTRTENIFMHVTHHKLTYKKLFLTMTNK